MIIDKKLKLVFDIETDAGKIHVHAEPISYETFEDNILLLASLKKSLIEVADEQDFSILAYPLLKKSGMDSMSLIREIGRGVNVAIDGKKLQLEIAIESKLIEPMLVAEIYSKLLFFTLELWMKPQAGLRAATMDRMTARLQFFAGCQTTSLDFMTYLKSLTTLTPDGNTGEKVTA